MARKSQPLAVGGDQIGHAGPVLPALLADAVREVKDFWLAAIIVAGADVVGPGGEHRRCVGLNIDWCSDDNRLRCPHP